MLLCVVYLTITTVKTNIAGSGVSAGITMLLFHSIGVDQAPAALK